MRPSYFLSSLASSPDLLGVLRVLVVMMVGLLGVLVVLMVVLRVLGLLGVLVVLMVVLRVLGLLGVLGLIRMAPRRSSYIVVENRPRFPYTEQWLWLRSLLSQRWALLPIF
jgi:hypothetical protein